MLEVREVDIAMVLAVVDSLRRLPRRHRQRRGHVLERELRQMRRGDEVSALGDGRQHRVHRARALYHTQLAGAVLVLVQRAHHYSHMMDFTLQAIVEDLETVFGVFRASQGRT